MPTYIYRAMTKTGVVVRNKVESNSKQQLIKTLKNNNLLPISIEQIAYRSRNAVKKKKKNVTDIQEIMKNVNTTQIGKNRERTLSTKEKINLYFAKTEKITPRDIVVFTQNFYLYNNGILFKCISIYIYKYDKSRGAIRITYKLIRTSCKIFR